MMAGGEKRREVVLLGCGRSVKDLTAEQVACINGAECVVALNKFMAFHRMTGIRPTHVWFTDVHPPCDRIVQYIFDVCRRDRLRGLTFVLHRQRRRSVFRSPMGRWRAVAGRAARRVLGRVKPARPIYRVPPGASFEFIAHHHYRTGGEWAASLAEPLYQYRTSFTSALNYIGITRPDRKVRLVGVDFTPEGYFFGEEMERLGLDWDDHTATARQEHELPTDAHFATLEYKGSGGVYEKFDFLRARLGETGNDLVCHNPRSEAVKRGLAEYEPLAAAAERAVRA